MAKKDSTAGPEPEQFAQPEQIQTSPEPEQEPQPDGTPVAPEAQEAPVLSEPEASPTVSPASEPEPTPEPTPEPESGTGRRGARGPANSGL